MVFGGIVLVVLGLLLVVGGVAVMARLKSTITRSGTEFSDGWTTTENRAQNKISVTSEKKKSRAVRVQGSLSIDEVAAYAAKGEMALPRAYVANIAGFSALMIGCAVLLFATGSPVPMALSALFGLYGTGLPFGFVRRYKASKTS